LPYLSLRVFGTNKLFSLILKILQKELAANVKQSKAVRVCETSRQLSKRTPHAKDLVQGYSNGGPRSESGPLNGDGRTSSASQRCIPYQKFLSQNFALLAVLPKHLLLANCVTVDQAVFCFSAKLQRTPEWASYAFLVQIVSS